MTTPAPNKYFGNTAKNLKGGLSAAFFTLPYSIAYGIVATSPLGVEAISLGAMLGLLSCIVSGLLGPLFASNTVLIGTPRAATALLYAGVLQSLLLLPGFQGDTPLETFQRCLPVLSALTTLGGILLLILNRFGLSAIVSKMPMPVIKGYVLASTLLSIYKQIPLIVGVSSIYLVTQGYWAVLAAAGFSAIVYFSVVKKFPQSPAAVFAFLVGTGVVSAFAETGYVDLIQFQFGNVQPVTVVFNAEIDWLEKTKIEIFRTITLIAPVLLALVFFISLETQITLAHLESSYKINSNAKDELNTIGWANIACGLLGTIPTGYYISGAVACINSGAKDRKSEWFYAVFVATILLTAPYFLSKLPTPVLGAVVITASLITMDKWVFKTAGELCAKRDAKDRKPLFISAGVSSVVVITALLRDFQAAILMGITLTTVLFLFQQSDNLIRAEYTLRQKRSTKMRNARHNALIEKIGNEAAVVALQGHLFFGNYAELKKTIGTYEKRTPLLIDCTNLIDADITGLECLKSIIDIRKSKGQKTWISGLDRPQHALDTVIAHADMHTLEKSAKTSEEERFLTLDDGLELLEDELLHATNGQVIEFCEPYQTDLLNGLNEVETAIVVQHSKKLSCRKGETLFSNGQKGDGMYVLLSGRVAVFAQGSPYKLRVMSYSPGVLFGEMAVIDQQPRMADALVEEDSTLLHLSEKTLEMLQQQHPQITQKLFLNIAKVLSGRLRTAMAGLNNL